jgi:hypothetical protein
MVCVVDTVASQFVVLYTDVNFYFIPDVIFFVVLYADRLVM